jgi:hypothetical protein
MYCEKHQVRGTAFAGGGGPCTRCGQNCDPPGDICLACALKADECRVCHVVVNSGRSQRMVRSIAAAERRRDHVVRVATKRHARIVDPLAAHVQIWQAETEASNALLSAPLREAGLAEADAKFEPYKPTWEAAESTHRTLVWRAKLLFDARIRQLVGHLEVDAGYKYECERVNSQSR